VSARTPLIAGNWKMNKTEGEAEEYIQALLPRLSGVDGVDVAICVPFTDLKAMVDSTRGSGVEVYAQNMHHEQGGAFTGEVSPLMLSEAEVQGTVLGHSERRGLVRRDRQGACVEGTGSADRGIDSDPVHRRD